MVVCSIHSHVLIEGLTMHAINGCRVTAGEPVVWGAALCVVSSCQASFMCVGENESDVLLAHLKLLPYPSS